MFYIFCVLITFPSSTYYVCGTVGVDLCKMCNLVISRPKIESHQPQRPNFCTQEMLQLRHMEMTETLQKGDREAYLSQLLIGVGLFFDYMYSESSSQPSS